MSTKRGTMEIGVDGILNEFNDIIMNHNLGVARCTSFKATSNVMPKHITDVLNSSLTTIGRYDPTNIHQSNVISLCKQLWVNLFDNFDDACDDNTYLSSVYNCDVTRASVQDALNVALRSICGHGDRVVYVSTWQDDDSDFRKMYEEIDDYSTNYYGLDANHLDETVRAIIADRPKVIIYAKSIMEDYSLIREFDELFMDTFREHESLRGKTQADRDDLMPKRIIDITNFTLPIFARHNDYPSPATINDGMDVVIFSTCDGMTGPQGAIMLYNNKIDMTKRCGYTGNIDVAKVATLAYCCMMIMWQSFDVSYMWACEAADAMSEAFKDAGLDVYCGIDRPDFIVDISSLLDHADMDDVLSYLLYKYNYAFDTCRVPGQYETMHHGLYINLFDIAYHSSRDIIAMSKIWVNNIIEGITTTESEAEAHVDDEDDEVIVNPQPKQSIGEFFRNLFNKGGK